MSLFKFGVTSSKKKKSGEGENNVENLTGLAQASPEKPASKRSRVVDDEEEEEMEMDDKESKMSEKPVAAEAVASADQSAKSKAEPKPVPKKEEKFASSSTEVKVSESKVDAVGERVAQSKPAAIDPKPEAKSENKPEAKSEAKSKAAVTTGTSVAYADLAELFEQIGAVSSRLAIQEEVKKFIQKLLKVCPDDLLRAVYLCINAVAPAFEGAELGVGDSILVRAIAEVTGRSKDALQTQYKELGDLGSVALAARAKQGTLFGSKPKALTIQEVFTQFRNLAKVSGSKSMEQKVGIIKKLLLASTGVEAKYLVRGLQGKLRIGLAEATVLVGLAHAVCHKHKEDGVEDSVTPDEAVAILKQVYSECPSYDDIIPAMLANPLSKLHEACHIRVGVPVKPMLAKPTKGVGEVLNRFEDTAFTCEYKYDGERAQIHRLENGDIRVFSRNLEDNTSKYPDVIEAMKEAIAESNVSFIVDAEVVAYDRVKKQIMPFQVLSTRARKDVGATENVKVQVVVFLFDMLYHNGDSLLKRTLRERREKMQSAFTPIQDKVQFAIGKDLSSTEDILEFLNESVKGNCEGLMIKTLERDATYEPSKRSLNWLKLKKDYMDNLSDSVDLVPIGGYYGKGKRTGVYGGFLMACFEPDSEELQSVCKVATGFSEESLEEQAKFFEGKTLPEKPRNYITGLDCDVWFDACVVWEIKAADLSVSPVHKAAIGSVKSDKGIGLRFPRFLRRRDDKKVEDATTCHQIEQMYREQAVIMQNGGGEEEEDDW